MSDARHVGFVRYQGLKIFPLPGNNAFETSDFADPHFTFYGSKDAALFHSILKEKITEKLD